ncbi:MAG: methyl-accepting chemotaxis protein, partial [Alphaproteobacteria bacterium]|nr:methyl-accepting chemotaxis protein [Alphaproteobacteria bacterium]
MQMKIGTKILLAASVVIAIAFSAFILYFNDELHHSTQESLISKLEDEGKLSTRSIASWIEGRKLLIENLGQNIAMDPSEENVRALISQDVLKNSFIFSYLGTKDGAMLMYPNDELPAGYDPRKRPWYQDASAAGTSTLTEPY